MNEIFKVIWNVSLNIWIAVGEFAKGKIKSKTTRQVSNSQSSSDLSGKSLSVKISLLAAAVMGVFGIQPAFAISVADCAALGSSCVAVSTVTQFNTALTSGTATTILLLNDITMSGNVTVNQATSNRKDLVIDGGGFTLTTGTSSFVFNAQTNASWGGPGSFTLSNMAALTSSTALGNTVIQMDGSTSAVNIILNGIGSVNDSMLAVLGVMGSGSAANLNSQLILGDFINPITLTFGTNHQLAQASKIKFTGHFDLTATTGSFPAVFWSNSANTNSLINFSSTADVSITTPLFTNGAVGNGFYQYTLEDGAKFALNSDQNVFGASNNGAQIGSYSAVTGFGSGAVLQLANTAGNAYTSGNGLTNVGGGNTGGMGNGVTQNGDVIYNLAADSKINLSAASSVGILATKTGAANSAGVYISSGATINAVTAGITAAHAGTGKILLENKAAGTITAATGISATNTGTATIDVVNKGIINSTSSGISVSSTSSQTVNVDNTGGTINASAGTGINVLSNALLNLVGGTITTTGAASGLTFAGVGGNHGLTDLILNLNGSGVAFTKAAGVNLLLSNVILNTANTTVLTSLAGLTFASSANGRNKINVTGTGTAISTANTDLTGWSPAALDITVSGAGTGINVTGGGVDLSGANLSIDVTNAGGTGLQITDGAVTTTTIGANTQINATGATAINFTGTTAKTFNNDGTINGAVTFAGTAANIINNNSILNGTLTTGAGNDTLLLGSSSQSNDAINLGAGNNNVTIQNGARVTSITTGAGDDTFTINNMTLGSTYLGSLNAGTGTNTLNINASTDTLATDTSLQGFANINLADSQITLASNTNVGSGAINIDGTSDLLFGSTFNGTLDASLGHVAAGDGSAIVNSGANVSLSQASTFAGDWLINQNGTLSASNSNQLGTTAIALNGILNLNEVTVSNNALTGTGALNIVHTGSNTFNFGINTGTAFGGSVDMQNSVFILSGTNTSALTNATLVASAGTIVSVDTSNQAIGNFSLNAGTAIFGTGSLITTNTLGVISDSTIRVDSTLSTGGNLLDQDTGSSAQLISSGNVLTAEELARLTLLDLAGNSLGDGTTENIIQGGNTVAQALYNFALSGEGGGLSVTSLLTQLELLIGQSLTLTSAGAVNGDETLVAQLTGAGNLIIGSDNSEMTLTNTTNDYTGSTSVNGGILNLGSDNALGATSALNTALNTQTNLNGHTQTVGALTNAGTLTLGTGGVLTNSGALTNSNTLNIAGGTLNLSAGGTSTATGGLTGSGALNINDGDLAVSGANSGLSGQTLIASGASATLNGAGTLGSSAINVLGDLNLNGANAAFGNVLSGSGDINTNAAVTLTGTNSFSGAHHIGAASALTVTQASNLGASTATVDLETATSHLVLNGLSGAVANALSGVAGSTVDINNGAAVSLTGNNSSFLGQYALADSSTLTVGSTNNLGAAASIALAGAQDILALSGFSGTFANTVTGNGILQVTDSSNVTLTSSNDVDNAVTVDITNATLNLADIALFDHALTGSGTLSVAKSDASTAFDFGSSVGGAFSGMVNLQNSTFNIDGLNTLALTNATLKLSSGSLTAVADGVQNIGGLALNGGTLLFNNLVDNSGVISSLGTIAANSINTTGGGIVRVNLPTNVTPDITGLSVMQLDEGEIIVTLASGAATGTGHELTLTDEFGDPLSATIYQSISNPGALSPAAMGSFNYGLTTGTGFDGLYVNYGLSALELLAVGDDALILTATLGNNGTQANDLSAQVTGSGDLAFVSANDGSVASLSNSTNSYTGATWVRSGNVRLEADSALGQTSLLAMSTATNVDLNGTQQTVGQLATEMGSTLDFNSGKLTVTNGGQVDGALTGRGELDLTGGLLSITQGNSGFTGSTDIASGATAHLYQVQGLGSGAINNNGLLNLDNTRGLLLNSLAGSGNVQLTNSANVQLAADNNGYSGLFTTDAGTVLTANNAGNLGSSSVANSGELILDTASVWNLTNSISGTGTLVKRGSGTVNIDSGTVSASLTTIENGLLQLGSTAPTLALIVNESPLARSLVGTLASNAVNLVSDVLITNTGSLGGYGQVTGNVENRGNLIMPNALTGGDFGTFTIDGNYTGDNGTVVFNTILAGDSSITDRLVITGNTAGQSFVTVNNIGGNGARTSEGIKIIDIGGDSAGQFTLNGRAVAGAYEYFLYQGGVSSPTDGDWYLRTQADERRPEPASYTANLAAANTMFVSSLADRSGETLYTDVITGEQKSTSLWLRNEGSHNRSRDDSGELKTQDNRYVMQLGGDVAQWSRNTQDLWRVGVMAGYANSSSSSVAQGTGYRSTGSVDGYSVGMYGTWFAEGQEQTGAYVDSWLQYSWFNNQVSGEGLTTEKYDSKGFTASVESGYAFKVGQSAKQNYFIQPKAQVVWMGVKADSHTETNGTVVTGEGNNNIQTRLGVKAFISPIPSADKANTPAFKPYVETNWIHNTKDFGTTLDGMTVKQAGAANVAELKLGVEGQINKQLNLWGNVGQQVGNNGYSDSSIALGVKYNF
ncbi:autotransporter outer membrane beta-barrel domain-containing protein [Yersinia aleksiciae]|uniref:autotransporter outer membrane beta-barrel domain-containing protein n=1 Tax=Yersinia aleksiciae TaxID=263819 RepID=UPI0011AB2522|nr:autotransporter outer membrane beta-barrel domain-containing protein [Yersinia aleksiciae]